MNFSACFIKRKDFLYPDGSGHPKCFAILSSGVPIISFIYGEGGSGGALALACGDQVWMLEDSMYSILSPEGFASILWKDSKRADEAAEVMQLTPEALLKQEIIEGIIPESNSHRKVCKEIKKILAQELKNLTLLTKFELVKRRKERYRKF